MDQPNLGVHRLEDFHQGDVVTRLRMRQTASSEFRWRPRERAPVKG